MKTKKLAITLGASLLAMTVSGCRNFGSFLPPKLQSLEVAVDPLKSFVAGDVFDDCADVIVTGTYSDGKTKVIDNSNIELIYISRSSGMGYCTYEKIPEAGNYTLLARRDGIYSNDYDFSVLANHVYANDIQVTNFDDLIMVGPGGTQDVTFSVSPSNFTEIVNCYVQDTTYATVSKVNSSTYRIAGLREGRTSLFFSSLGSEKGDFVVREFPIVIRQFYVKTIDVIDGKHEFVQNEDYTFKLSITPTFFSVPVEAESSSEAITIFKSSNTEFLVFGDYPGEATITFHALSGPDTMVSATYDVVVTAIYAQSMVADGEAYIGVGESDSIWLTVSPEEATVKPIFIDDYDHDIIELWFVEDYPERYNITGSKVGKTTLHFKIENGPSSFIYCSYQVVVKNIYARDITFDDIEYIEARRRITFHAHAVPETFNRSFTYKNDYQDILSVKYIGGDEFELYGFKAGEAWVNFYAPASEETLLVRTKHFVVTDDYVSTLNKTKLKQTFHDLDLIQDRVGNCPSLGDVNMLVIPVWFKDSWKFIGADSPYLRTTLRSMRAKRNVYDDIKTAFFGTNEETGWRSVSSYYLEDSDGRFRLGGTVTGWYTCDMTSDEFILDNTYGYKQLVTNAVDWYFSTYNPNDKRTNYDSDGDGYIDAIAIIYALADENSYPYYAKTDGTFWGTKTNLGDTSLQNKNKPGPNAYFRASYDFMYSSTSTALERVYTPYHRGSNAYAKVCAKTFCHETGHLFGVHDLYDYTKTVDWSSGLTMQADGRGYHDPFSTMAFGWADPFIPTESCTVVLNDYTSSRELLLLTPQWNDLDSPFDEYIVLELTSYGGLNEDDIKLAYSNIWNYVGIRMYHVNATLFNLNTGTFTNDAHNATEVAFNNTNVGGRLSEASKYDEKYQKYSMVHLIRHDTNGNTKNAIDYYSKATLAKAHFFDEGDKFDMLTYNRQFVDFYNQCEALGIDPADESMEASKQGITARFDFGQEFGWEIEIMSLYNKNYKGMAEIKLTKIA